MKFIAPFSVALSFVQPSLASGRHGGYRKRNLEITRQLADEESSFDPSVIKVGLNLPLSGPFPSIGDATIQSALLWMQDVYKDGGITVGETMLPVILAEEDNRYVPEDAALDTKRLAKADKVLVMIGPQSSNQAIPAGEKANDLKTPMISPWSTNPATTLDRPWVFRMSFLDDFQGQTMATFAKDEFNACNAAVLFNADSTYSSGIATFFSDAWVTGGCEVVASESFSTDFANVTTQLTAIIASEAEFIVLPQTMAEVRSIIEQAQTLGWNRPFLGSDTWNAVDIMENCGELCEGYFFTSVFLPEGDGISDEAKAFSERYKMTFGDTADDIAALTWDAFNLAKQSIEACGDQITGDITNARECVRENLAQTTDFSGITGALTYDEQGDPEKCVSFVRLLDGEIELYQEVCPGA